MGEKIKVEELGCFEEVAKVIGVERAKVELFKVINETPVQYLWDVNGSLVYAFSWHNTVQGYDFWSAILVNTNPYE